MKTSLADLALFGGVPLFSEPLYVGRPNIGDRSRLRGRFDRMLDRRWLTNDGPFVNEFEKTLASRLGVRHCIATCNATSALGLAIRALDMRGEVIVPSFTFVATAHALTWHGIRPVFCDIDPRTHQLDLAALSDLVTPETSGIIAVHLWGRACDIEGLSRFAADHGIALLFDAAHALGGRNPAGATGGSGHVEVLSFHATKIANAFEGGAVATNDDVVASRVRSWRNFGFIGSDYAEDVGINAKMSEASAAMGLTSLESLDEFIAVNRRHYSSYVQELTDIPGLELPDPGELEGSNYHYVVVQIDGSRAHIGRDALLRVLTAEGVHARRYFFPGCHRLPPYASASAGAVDLPVTDDVAARVMQFPTGSAVSDDEIRRICELIRFVFSHAESITTAMNREASLPL